MRQKRAFSQKNLAAHHEGPLGPLLERALTIPEEPGYTGTHAFHPYPGRFHPLLPRTVLPEITQPGERVFDPFMGGGTTLVEAMCLGRNAAGNDLNPIAGLVAKERTRLRTPAKADWVKTETLRIAGQVEALRQEKNPPRLAGPRFAELSPHYAPHLMAELVQWIRLIEKLPRNEVQETLKAVFSSSVVKFSNQRSDTESSQRPVNFPKGAISRFMVEKCEELLRAQVELAQIVPRKTKPVRLFNEDARMMPSLRWEVTKIILTSPPYPGTYDYHQHHQMRLVWLGLSEETFLKGEIGSRREAANVEAQSVWSEDLRNVFGTMARLIQPGGVLLIVMGDWISAEHAVDASTALTRVAQSKDWQLTSKASIKREVFSRAERKAFSKKGKWEHLLHFTRYAAPEAPSGKD